LLFQIALELEGAPVKEYSQRLFKERSWGPMAESETYAHLEHLRRDGRLSNFQDADGVLRYQTSP
jgi:hypothetical protein